MKKWRSGTNRHELLLQSIPVCTLHYTPHCGYYCSAQVGNGIQDESFGFCTLTEAKRNTEAWYAGQMRILYRMYRRCATECLDRLRDLGASEKV